MPDFTRGRWRTNTPIFMRGEPQPITPMPPPPPPTMTGIVLSLPHRRGNPRNSEGAFVDLADGRILFAYTKFIGKAWGDHGTAVIAARFSDERADVVAAGPRPDSARGPMQRDERLSPRLQDGSIGLFSMRKNSLSDCIPYLRKSSDEGRTWSKAVRCIPAPGYFVLNNDRVIQLGAGRLVLPAAFHRGKSRPGTSTTDSLNRGASPFFFISDDSGRTWREARDWWALPRRSGSGLQEPGVVELPNGSLYAWCRTDIGRQWEMVSRDGGETWTRPRPSPFCSPNSPLSIKHIPQIDTYLAVWNDHRPAGTRSPPERFIHGAAPHWSAALGDPADPSWSDPAHPRGRSRPGFCYTAIHPTRDAVLLAYCCGGRGSTVLQDLCIRRIGGN